MTTGLYLLRAAQCGFSCADLDFISIGMLFDVFTEAENDHEEYDEIATQEDINRL